MGSQGADVCACVPGILLVFDVTNSRSYHNLKKWIREIVAVDKNKPLEERSILTGDVFHTSLTTSPSLGSSPSNHSPPSFSRMLPSLLSTQVEFSACGDRLTDADCLTCEGYL